ncbi:hypothetical protein [Bartonella australis]|uniref:hypothetical protein n=1 Tax=Bartonella australis TaxID=388640 RepID=UPI000346EDFB|nr:hypothetical protein [Bartonella australis]
MSGRNMIPCEPKIKNINTPFAMSGIKTAKLREKQRKYVVRGIHNMLKTLNNTIEPKFGPNDFEGTYPDSIG